MKNSLRSGSSRCSRAVRASHRWSPSAPLRPAPAASETRSGASLVWCLVLALLLFGSMAWGLWRLIPGGELSFPGAVTASDFSPVLENPAVRPFLGISQT